LDLDLGSAVVAAAIGAGGGCDRDLEGLEDGRAAAEELVEGRTFFYERREGSRKGGNEKRQEEKTIPKEMGQKKKWKPRLVELTLRLQERSRVSSSTIREVRGLKKRRKR
jgi:hypothetical protein